MTTKIHTTTHIMCEAMGGKFQTFTVIWAGGHKTFTDIRSAYAFQIEKEHGITT